MRPAIKRLRRAVCPLLSPYHKPWFRQWKDGTIWCGCHSDITGMASYEAFAAMCHALDVAGYAYELKGKPGTSGEWIIDLVTYKPIGKVEWI